MATIEQRRENNFWHIVDYLADELVCLDSSLSGKSFESLNKLITDSKVDIFDTLEGIAKKILSKKTIYGVSFIDGDNIHHTLYVDIDSDLTGVNFIKNIKLKVFNELKSENYSIISIFKIP